MAKILKYFMIFLEMKIVSDFFIVPKIRVLNGI